MKHPPTDEQLEQWLKSLPLRHPSSALDRILRPAHARPVVATLGRWALAAGLGAIASFPLGLWYGAAAQSAPPAQPVAAPVTPTDNRDSTELTPRSVEVVWDAPEVVDVQTDADGRPVYALQQAGLERRRWSDPDESTTLETLTPQQRVGWVPGQAY